MPMAAPDDRLQPDELRTLFLFESLDDDQLAWLSENGRVQHVPTGPIYTEGEDATCFYVLLDGECRTVRRVGTDDVEVNRTSYRGVTRGLPAYLGDRFRQNVSQLVARHDAVDLFLLPAAAWADSIRAWFPMAIHLLEGLFFRMQNTNRLGQQERLLALGSLSAGLTHEPTIRPRLRSAPLRSGNESPRCAASWATSPTGTSWPMPCTTRRSAGGRGGARGEGADARGAGGIRS